MIDRWLQIDEVTALTDWSRRTVYNKIQQALVVVRPGDAKGLNGRAQTEVALSSLPEVAQVKYWQTQRRETDAATRADLPNLAEWPQWAIDEAHRREAIVLDAVTALDGAERGAGVPRLDRIAEATGISRSTLYDWIAAWRARGFAGLKPKWGATSGTFRAMSPALQDFVTQEYLSDKQPSPTTIYERLDSLCRHLKQPTPSQSTVNRFLVTLPEPAVLLARKGPRAYAAKAMPKVHRDYLDLQVGEQWVGDHRLLDVFVLTHRGAGAQVFRPWLTAWEDLRSRAIVGWTLGEVPNSGTIATALRRGILAYGKPQHLYMDNGKDYTCHYWGGHPRRPAANRADLDTGARGVLRLLGIDVTHAQPYSPWSKAIESWFGHCLPEWEKTLPGWCGSDNQDKPEKLTAELKSGELLTLDELLASLTARIADYHARPHSGEGMQGQAPQDVWATAVKQIPEARALDLLLMKHRAVTVQNFGIKLFGFRYWHDELHLVMRQPVEVRYDRADIGRLIVFKGHEFLCEALADSPFAQGMTEAQKLEVGRRRKAARRNVMGFLANRKVLFDPDEVLRQVVAARAPVGTPPPEDPAPVPQGETVPLVTGFERPAARLRATAAAGEWAGRRRESSADRRLPAIPAAAADEPALPRLTDVAPRRAPDRQADKDALLDELLAMGE